MENTKIPKIMSYKRTAPRWLLHGAKIVIIHERWWMINHPSAFKEVKLFSVKISKNPNMNKCYIGI